MERKSISRTEIPLTLALSPAFADLLAEQVLWQARPASRRP